MAEKSLPPINASTARGLRPDVHQIRIESILGGESPTTQFAGADQFGSSLGIDPAMPILEPGTNTASNIVPLAFYQKASGLLRPSPYKAATNSVLSHAPMWLIKEPKVGNIYVYDVAGSTYTFGTTITALSDAGNMSNSHGNGSEYYDNYMYFAKDTDIARYGPLNGSPSFNGAYWTGTLSKSALVNTTYPSIQSQTVPNHFLHRHSDGKLYIADVVGNQGALHVISTTKTSVEGDTDNGSKSSAITFGYGLWPVAIESYGSSIAVALFEGAVNGGGKRAKIAFWDTTSSSFNSITWVEYPDEYITAMKNINGTLYIFSSSYQGYGFRLTRYIGGSSFEDIDLLENAVAPMPGAVDGNSNRIVFGSNTNAPQDTTGSGFGCTFSYGLSKPNLPRAGRFTVSKEQLGTQVTSLLIAGDSSVTTLNDLYIGWGTPFAPTSSNNGVDYYSPGNVNYSTNGAVWNSQVYRIGQPFKITKIRIPVANPATKLTDPAMTTNMSVVPTIFVDNGRTSFTLPTINSLNAGVNPYLNYVVRPVGLTGGQDFLLKLVWTGSDLTVLGLPILIEYELVDID